MEKGRRRMKNKRRVLAREVLLVLERARDFFFLCGFSFSFLVSCSEFLTVSLFALISLLDFAFVFGFFS